MARKFWISERFFSRLARMLRWFESRTDEVFWKPPDMGTPAFRVLLRQGKLDAELSVGGSATVSLWWNSAAESWDEDLDADSGENWEDCLGPFTQSSAIASGTKVMVLSVNGVRMIVGAEC